MYDFFGNHKDCMKLAGLIEVALIIFPRQHLRFGLEKFLTKRKHEFLKRKKIFKYKEDV